MSREQTNYAKNRPRRELPGPRNTLGVTTESLELCRLHEFMGAPGSGAPLAQPFNVYVAAEVDPSTSNAEHFSVSLDTKHH